ncbi:Transcriptional regulator, TetR family [Pseudonocardia sp. Ae717_Ps2]|uniref:TetR/AcrR family transcriptional regulator n=1 Tax=unclassified Pseudonocardia TaxID=2619320 RepID=UPI00094B2260|nr:MULTISPECIES: TetR family transcriptional regulator [unclassified Pseudonocardia]OLM14549.1 Transcriptional regulator, TetR family [Pseudonocardia sp. Ae505_Ps2]OLM31707.1 Transcriptional regulator, TetR family [Pseudonocardia sp. Ae717_Ps2]
MPRRKQVPDADVLDLALGVLHTGGAQALTFAALAQVSGLAPATLVQRFGGKAELLHRVLMHAWDQLERRTAELGEAAAPGPEGAVAFLVGLSAQYGGIDSYADALLVLREDLLDPESRRRGREWRETLGRILDTCLEGPPGAGAVLATYWQGTLLWWSFDPALPVTEYVRRELTAFVTTVLRPA